MTKPDTSTINDKPITHDTECECYLCMEDAEAAGIEHTDLMIKAEDLWKILSTASNLRREYE